MCRPQKVVSCQRSATSLELLIPTFQRLLSKAVVNFNVHKSMPKLILHGFSKTGILYFRDNLKIPSKENISQISLDKDFP